MKRINENWILARYDEMEIKVEKNAEKEILWRKTNLKSIGDHKIKGGGDELFIPWGDVYRNPVKGYKNYKLDLGEEFVYVREWCIIPGMEEINLEIWEGDIRVFPKSDGRLRLSPTGEVDSSNIAETASNCSIIALKYGFDIPAAAFEHNYEGWAADFKTYYKAENGFVYSACGGNPLYFEIEHLNEEDYQCTMFA